jgi:uncharacterized repeat protein (TIGR02543 family)
MTTADLMKGSTFTGWNFTGTWFMPQPDGTDYPKLAWQTFDVTVSGSYATNTGAGKYEAGATVTISAGSRAGYAFAGWTTTTPGVTFANADAAITTFTMPSRATAVMANWMPVYTLAYNANGGNGMVPGNQTGGVVTISGNGGLARTNYTFAGWNNAANGGGTAYRPGSVIALTANMTLYAQWAPVAVNENPAYNGPTYVLNSQATITFSISGKDLNRKSQLFLDIDGRASTGYNYHWKESGFEFLVEDGALYSYSGKNNGWQWTRVSSAAVAKSNTTITITIPLIMLKIKAGDQIAYGFISNDIMNASCPLRNERLYSYTIK